MIETRAYDRKNDDGFPPDPVVVLVATGSYDVSSLVWLLNGGPAKGIHTEVGKQIQRQVRRHNAGQAALRLLRDYGGPDFTDDALTPVDDPELFRQIRLAISDPGAFVSRDREDRDGETLYESLPNWGARAVVAALTRAAALHPAEDATMRKIAAELHGKLCGGTPTWEYAKSCDCAAYTAAVIRLLRGGQAEYDAAEAAL